MQVVEELFYADLCATNNSPDCPLPPQEELNDITPVHLTEVHHTRSSVEIQIQFCPYQATLYGINAAHISWKLLHGKFHL